jgi:TolB-like protein
VAQDRVERRLAAILATDMVGYSRLMEMDEEGTIARQKTHRKELIDPKIAEHRGRVVKTTGDGLLVEFASAVDAVRCAADVQRAIAEREAGQSENRRIAYRVGINVGDVVVDGDDILGDGVNIAARLEGLAEPGGIFVSGNVHEQVAGKLDLAFEDKGEQAVKNIKKPVRVYRVRMDGRVTGEAGAAADTGPTLELPEKPSIAVLPFENMSGDAEQEYFADGIAEDIITALSRFQWFFVIARNSSFTYKGRAVDVKRVAADLGVQYVLEGSVRKAGQRVRISAQLIDALTGRHVWAERYDRELEDIFAIQDEITEAIAGAVAPAFVTAEERKAQRKAPKSFDAWDYVMRGTWHLWRYGPPDVSEAKHLFRTAIDLDPNSSIALCGYASALQAEFFNGWTDDPKETLMQAFQFAQRAITADENDAWAHAVLGILNTMTGKYGVAFDSCQRALELNPNLAFAEAALSLTYALSGDEEEAILHADKAARLSPRDPATGIIWRLARAVVAFLAGHYENQAKWARSMTELFPDWPGGWRHLAVGTAHLGQLDAARTAVDELLRLVPHESIGRLRTTVPLTRSEDLERFLDGLRKAGLPE